MSAAPLLTAVRVAYLLRKGGHRAVTLVGKSYSGRMPARIVHVAGFRCTQAKSFGLRKPCGPVIVHCYATVVAEPITRERYEAACLGLLVAYEQTLRAAGCTVCLHTNSFGMHLEVSL